MPSQVIVIFASGLFALGCIWVLISGFDDNDGDGMTSQRSKAWGLNHRNILFFKGRIGYAFFYKV